MNISPLVLQLEQVFEMPVYKNIGTEDDDEYIVFNYADERPILRAGDDDLFDRTEIQVHLYTRSDSEPYKPKLRRELKRLGFTILNTREVFENDTKYTHITVECFVFGEIEEE